VRATGQQTVDGGFDFGEKITSFCGVFQFPLLVIVGHIFVVFIFILQFNIQVTELAILGKSNWTTVQTARCQW
jgi:hypothetical protein